MKSIVRVVTAFLDRFANIISVVCVFVGLPQGVKLQSIEVLLRIVTIVRLIWGAKFLMGTPESMALGRWLYYRRSLQLR